MTSSGKDGTNPLGCLGHACGIANEATSGIGDPTLAAANERQVPDAHQDTHQDLCDAVS